jgi:hypothetical protein
MRITGLLFLTILLFSCGGTEKPEKLSEFDRIDRDTNPIPAAPPITTSNPKPIDAAWNDYWGKFKEAVKNDARSYMYSLVNFPLPGANQVSEFIYAEKASQDDLRQGYNQIFDDLVKRAVERTGAGEVDSYTLIGDEFKGSMAEKVGLAEGSTIYEFKVNLITKTNSGTTALGADIFHFGKFKGVYKLAWISVDRPE